MFETIRKWLYKVTAPKCKHMNFTVKSKFGPTTGRHKVWYSCQCNDCQQWFVYEELSGQRFMMDGPGFGYHKI